MFVIMVVVMVVNSVMKQTVYEVNNMCKMEGLTDEEIIELLNWRIRCKEWLSVIEHYIEIGNKEQLMDIEDRLEMTMSSFNKLKQSS